MHFLAIDINVPVIIVVGIAVIALLVFLIRRNVKDEKDFEDTVNQVEKKPLEHDEKN